MAVLKNLRRLSNMEYYENAIKLRKEMTKWILRDFGIKHKVHDVKVFSKKLSDYDKQRIYDVLSPYDLNDKVFGYSVPDWFYDGEREDLRTLCKELVQNIVSAYVIRVYTYGEYERCRTLQNNAIATCFLIYSELESIRDLIPYDLNKQIEIFELLDTEIDLLQSWKKSTTEAYKKHNKENN